MSNPSTLKITGILIIAGLCGFPHSGYAAYTQAGFQWVVPSDAPVVQGAPTTSVPNTYASPSYASPGYASPYSGRPPVVSGPEIISPVVIGGGGASVGSSVSSPVIVSNSNINRQVNPVVVNNSAPMITGAPVVSGSMSAGETSEILSSARAVPAAPMQEPAVASSSEIVQGFAKQVPLAVALRQLLPPGYGFSVDQNVDLGTLVSFQGGQSWRETLHVALEPVGLVMREQGQMVTIAKGDRNSTVPVRDVVSSPKPVSVATIPTHSLQPMTGATDSIVLPAGENGAGPVIQSWSAERGDTLHKILEEWSRRANVEFDWKSEYDYPLQASVAFSGTFEDAVRNLLTGFEGAHPQPIAELHANSNLGQMVLVVSMRGNNYSD